LVLLILPLALLAFRRGWLLGLIMILTLSSNVAHAMSWQDLWLRKDQQAAKALADNDPQQAASLFNSPPWKGVAEYRAGNYEGAVAALGPLDSAEAHYNRGNALAMNGRLEEALKAYDQAMRRDQELADAKFNKELVEKLLQQQKEQQQQQGEKQKPGSGDSPQGQEKGGQGQDQQGNEQGAQSQAADRQDKEQGEQENNGARTGEQKKDDSAKDVEQSRSAAPKEAAEAGKEQAAGSSGEEAIDEQSASAQSQAAPEDKLSGEQQQALEQWLRKIPDNPGGLLKRKFEYQYRQNQDRDSQSPKKIW
jgi:Ca-activated chloride channel family protein